LYAVRIITSKASTATSFKVSSCVRPSWNSPYNAVLSGLERLANGQRCPKEWHTSGPATATASQRSSSASQLSHLLSWACEPRPLTWLTSLNNSTCKQLTCYHIMMIVMISISTSQREHVGYSTCYWHLMSVFCTEMLRMRHLKVRWGLL
jgi:hypothetical protein